MAVRKIPKNHLVVTGRFASRKNRQMDEFESLLEKEYMLLLDFDERVERFDSQPITIPVPGVPKGYTPDFLVHYLPDETGKVPKPLLTEVKHTDDLDRNAEKYAPKFHAAELYARDAGWEFRKTTQLDIRTPRLANLKFLREYRNIAPATEDQTAVLDAAARSGGTVSLSELLGELAPTDDGRLHWLPVIWHAVVNCQLVADLDRPLGNDPLFQLPRSGT